MESLIERLNGSSPGPVSDRLCSVTHQLQGVYDNDLINALYEMNVSPDEDPLEVYMRLREVGVMHYTSKEMLPPLNFTQAVLAGMFSAPWTTDAFMEYVLDVFE